MMRRIPWVLILALALMWLLLTSHVTLGQWLLGLLVAAVMTLAFRGVRPQHPRLRRPLSMLRLVWRATLDILRSNLAVARIVLGRTGGREVHSGFVEIPLELRDPHGLAVLSMIVTATPGTVWSGLSPDNEVMTLHVLDLRDAQATRDYIKHHYEDLLLEIFE